MPVDRLREPGRFWAFFPTQTESLAAGILNAPWKTNSDRQNLLPGAYNDDLIKAAAGLIAKSVATLSSRDDPGRHLDALPRRHEQGDHAQANLLRDSVYAAICERRVIPDQKGRMCLASDLQFPPEVPAAALVRWEACEAKPQRWAHSRALTRDRLPRLKQIAGGIARVAVPKWLSALVSRKQDENAIDASRAAIETAAILFREGIRHPYGDIVLTVAGNLAEPDSGSVALPDSAEQDTFPDTMLVHHELTASEETLTALATLGVRSASRDTEFEMFARYVLGRPVTDLVNDAGQRAFWETARTVSAPANIIMGCEGWQSKLRIRTRAGEWASTNSALLPGPIVSEDDDADAAVTVDVDFHAGDVDTLRALGVVDRPSLRSLRGEACFPEYLGSHRDAFQGRQFLKSRPKDDLVNFRSYDGPGPLQILEDLSPDSRYRYAYALLEFDQALQPWVLRHTNEQLYPPLECESPIVWLLRRLGVVDQASWERWRNHPRAVDIREAFNLEPPEPEPIGEGPPIPLTDAWPGLREHLRDDQQALNLVRCDRIAPQSAATSEHWQDTVYVVRGDDEQELYRISNALDLGLNDTLIREVLQPKLEAEIEEARAAVRAMTTDAERLLRAVGGSALQAVLTDIATFLRQHEGLRELNAARRTSAITKSVKSDAHTEDLFRRMVRSSRAIATILQGTGRIPSPTGGPNVDGDPFEGRRYPTFLRWQRGKPFMEKDCPVNAYCEVELETDAENDFLERPAHPGECVIEPDGWVKNLKLWDGKLSIRLQPPPGTAVGSEIPLRVAFQSPEMDTMSVEGQIRVTPEHTPGTHPPGPPRNNPAGVPAPDIREVREGEWDAHEFDERSVARVDSEGDRTIVFVNMDNRGVHSYCASEPRRAEELREMFKIASAALAVSLTREVQRDGVSQEDANKAFAAIGDVLVPVVDFAGKVKQQQDD